MYKVTLNNNGVKTVVNEDSISIEAPRLLTGSIKKGINTINNFTFTITPNNPGYILIKPYATLVEILNTNTNLTEFLGRALLPKSGMDATGALLQTVTCESELGYLMDSITRYGEYHNITVKAFLEVIIANHNLGIEDYKKFTVGTVNVSFPDDTIFRYLGDDKTLDAIKSKLINILGGELQIRYVNGVRYLDYLTEIGTTKTTEIRLSKNLITLEQEKDPTTVISRLRPLGAKSATTDQRLDITSVNNGIDYIDDPEAIAKFGIQTNTFTWDDVTTASALLTKGNAKLVEVNKIQVKYKISALDLSTIGLDIDAFNAGNYYPVINELMAIDDTLRVLETTTDINSPQNSTLTIGDKLEDIKTYQLGILKANKNITILADNLNSTIGIVASVNEQLGLTVENVATIASNVLSINTTLIKLKQRSIMGV